LFGTRRAFISSVIEMLLSDPVIFLATTVGLCVTALSIVRDTRSQRARSRTEEVRVEA
jgi:hypothetical protein